MACLLLLETYYSFPVTIKLILAFFLHHLTRKTFLANMHLPREPSFYLSFISSRICPILCWYKSIERKLPNTTYKSKDPTSEANVIIKFQYKVTRNSHSKSMEENIQDGVKHYMKPHFRSQCINKFQSKLTRYTTLISKNLSL